MKDRWKIFITCLVIALFVVLLISFLGSSFKQISLREYGIMYHEIFSNVQNQTVRTNGNYLVGMDHSFHTFPRGIISFEYHILALTKDKSMITVEGFFAGKLVKGEIMSMYENYGN